MEHFHRKEQGEKLCGERERKSLASLLFCFSPWDVCVYYIFYLSSLKYIPLFKKVFICKSDLQRNIKGGREEKRKEMGIE